MKTLLLLVVALLCVSSVSAQSSATIDESLVKRPDQAIDYPGCYSDLNKADRNGDGFVKQNEYLNFIQEYGKRICFSTDALTLQQSATFNTLACICRDQDGASDDCCLAENARISTAGALVPQSDQTPNQQNYLTTVCKLTDATIDGRCPSEVSASPSSTPVAPPVVSDLAAPPPTLVAPPVVSDLAAPPPTPVAPPVVSDFAAPPPTPVAPLPADGGDGLAAAESSCDGNRLVALLKSLPMALLLLLL